MLLAHTQNALERNTSIFVEPRMSVARWRMTFEGVIPRHQDVSRGLTYQWRPKPNDVLKLQLNRPEVKPGASQSVDRAELEFRLGDTSHRGSLELQLLAASPGEYTLEFKEPVTIDQATLNGHPLYDIKEGLVRVQLEPGNHAIAVEWQQAAIDGYQFRPSDIQSSLPL